MLLKNSIETLILAAGRGSRLRYLSNGNPKSLMRINDIPILENLYVILENFGIVKHNIVIGYLKEKIIEFSSSFTGREFNYIENPYFDSSGTAYSLYLALQHMVIPDRLLVIEGDIFFKGSLLEYFLSFSEINMGLVHHYSEQYEGSFVTLNKYGEITSCWHLSMLKNFKIVNLSEQRYKTINIYCFSRDFIQNIFIPILERLQNNLELKTLPFEYVINDSVSKWGGKIRAIINSAKNWYEIDTPEDIKYAENMFSAKQ